MIAPRRAALLTEALAVVNDRVPEGWRARLEPAERDWDASLVIEGPDEEGVRFAVDAGATIPPERTLDVWLRGQLSAAARPVIVARYINERLRERLRGADIGFVDLTGNVWLASDRPALFLRDVGASSDPWRGPGRPQQSLKGRPAALVVRALLDFRGPLTLPELARRSGASTGAVYRVVEYLEREQLVDRTPRGPVAQVEWRVILERWAQANPVLEVNRYRSMLAPRGIESLIPLLRDPAAHGLCAVTGTLGIQDIVSIAPARTAMLYARDLDAAAEALGLRDAEQGANVLLIDPTSDVVFDRMRPGLDIPIVAESQAAADLLTSPGRGPEEAVALLDWMERNESAWRS